MTRVLLVTNDFPPRPGGIQSYLEQFVGHLAATGEHQTTGPRRTASCAIPAR